MPCRHGRQAFLLNPDSAEIDNLLILVDIYTIKKLFKDNIFKRCDM